MLNVVPFIMILLVNSLITGFSRQKFGKMLPLTMMLITFTLYLSQLIGNTFKYGYLLIIAAAAGGLVSMILSCRKNEGRARQFSNGFWIFLIIFCIYFFIDLNRHLSVWDELMHWGKMVKEMLRLDRFYFVDASTLLKHKDYPPFISLFELFWCRFSGGYSEMGVSMAIHVFELSIVVPFLLEDSRLGARIREIILRGACWVLFYIVLIFFLDQYETFDTIYTDILIGLMFAYSMYLVYSKDAYRDGWGYATYLFSLVSMVSTKQIGIGFAMISFFYFTVLGIRKKGNPVKKIILGLLPIAACIAIYFVWSRLIASYQISGQFDLKGISLKDLPGYLKSGTAEREMINRFVKALFERNLITGFIPVTYISFILLLILLICLLSFAKNLKLERNERILTGVSLVGGAIGYAAAMLVVYVFSFIHTDPNEAINMSSFPRYMGSYITGAIVFLSFVSVDTFREKVLEKLTCKQTILCLLSAMILLTPANIKKLMPSLISGDRMHTYHETADRITSVTEPGKTVYLGYTQTWADAEQCFVSYYADGIYIDRAYMDILNIDFRKNKAELEKAINLLKKDDYLYLCSVTESFNQAFSEYNQNQEFVAGKVYKITEEDGILQFQLIDT